MQEGLRELVVCSLEPWDEVWRRNQFLVRELLDLYPSLEVLFVDPPLDLLRHRGRWEAHQRRGLRPIGSSGGLWRLQPLKLLPRVVGPFADKSLARQLYHAVGELGFTRPVLWINDSAYAMLLGQTSWPTLYDITDDWLLTQFTSRRDGARLRRREELLLRESDAVVVCSNELARSRGAVRDVVLIPNGVDVARFQTPRPRPADLPSTPVAVYVGTLHEERLDVDLCLELARRLPETNLALVGPDALPTRESARLSAQPNIHLLGPRPHDDVPAYLQHGDVIVVPHVITPFTASLDPIKAYECLAVDTPTVATPVAGFHRLERHLRLASRAEFVQAVAETLRDPPPRQGRPLPPTWRERAEQFALVLEGISQGASVVDG